MKNISVDKKTIRRVAENIFYPLLGLAVILAFWAIFAKAKDNPLVLPMPDVVLQRFFTLGASLDFWKEVGATLLRTLICFITSFVLALLFASLAGLWKPFNKIMSPIVAVLRAVPTVAAILIMYAFFRNDTMAILVGFLIAFPIMYSAFYTAIISVDKDLLEMAKVYKIKPFDKVRSIYLPSIEGCLFDTSRSSISLTLKIIVASEILTNISVSIGGSIQVAYASFEIEYLLARTLVAIVFSLVLEWLVSIIKWIREVTK